MARYDVFRNTNPATVRRFPFLLVVQSDLLGELATQVVVPLGRAATVEGKLAQRLTPELGVEGETMVMFTPELAAVPASTLRKRVANLDAHRDAIRDALDLLFSGI